MRSSLRVVWLGLGVGCGAAVVEPGIVDEGSGSSPSSSGGAPSMTEASTDAMPTNDTSSGTTGEVDLDVFHTTMASPEVAAQLEADQALFAAVGGQGTPSWVVNGAFNVGAQPYAVFEAAAADELEAMREAVDAGVPPCVAFEQRLDVLLP